MSNKDTILTKIHHENSAKSVHEDAKKALAENRFYDPTDRLMAEMKANAKHPGLDGDQAPAKSVMVPEVEAVEVKSATPAKDSVQEAQTKKMPASTPAPQHPAIKAHA